MLHRLQALLQQLTYTRRSTPDNNAKKVGGGVRVFCCSPTNRSATKKRHTTRRRRQVDVWVRYRTNMFWTVLGWLPELLRVMALFVL